MASTRNKNSIGDYQNEIHSYTHASNYMTYDNAGKVENNYFAGDGLLMGRMASENLASNACDIESQLFVVSIPVERSIGKSFEGAFYRESALWRRHGVARWVSWVTRYLGAYTHVVREHVVRGITRGRRRSASGPRIGARPIWVQAHGRH